MPSPSANPDEPSDAPRAVTWLRVVKLVLSIVLLVLGILEALGQVAPG